MNFSQFIALFLTFLLCAVQLQGVQDLGVARLVVFGLWLIAVILSFGKKIGVILTQRRFLALYVFVVFYLISSVVIVPFGTAINRCVELLCIASPILMYEFIKDKSHNIRISFVLFTSFIFIVNSYLAFQFINLIGVDSFRNAQEFGDEFYVIMISFNMCYALSLIVPAFWGMYKELKNKFLYRLLFIGLIILLLFYLLRAQFMTAIIIAFIGLTLEFLYRRNIKIIVASLVIVIVTSFSLFVVLPITIQQLKGRGDFEVLVYRLVEIENVISGNDEQADDYNARKNLRTMSLSTFINNPLFGINHRINSKVHVNDQGIGNHAEWIDCLAKYGFFSLFLFYFLFDSLKRQKKEIHSPVTMIMFILLGFLNPLWLFPQVFAAYLYIPLLYSVGRGANKNSRIMKIK